MQAHRAGEELILGLDVLGVGQAALDRAHSLTSFVIVEPDALGAEVRIDDVDFVALADGLVRALRLAGTAVDAVVGDVRRHK